MGGLVWGSWERQNPRSVTRPPRGPCAGEGMAAPGRPWPQLPEEGPGMGQRRLSSAVSVSGSAINNLWEATVG